MQDLHLRRQRSKETTLMVLSQAASEPLFGGNKLWEKMVVPILCLFPDTGPKPREARPLDQFQVATWGI